MGSLGRYVPLLEPGLTEVEAIVEDIAPSVPGDSIAESASVALGVGVVRPFFKGPPAGGHLAEGSGDEGAVVRMHLDPGRASIVLVGVAERSLLGPTALLDALLHTLLDLDGEILRVPGGDDLHHPTSDVARGSGGVSRLTDALDDDAKVFKLLLVDDEVVVVAGEAVELVDEDDVELLRPGFGDHLLELGALVGASALAGIDELPDYLPALASSMVATALQLEGYGEVSLRLLVGADPGIDAAPQLSRRGLLHSAYLRVGETRHLADGIFYTLQGPIPSSGCPEEAVLPWR